jgi:apolipoprotein N-acyltransferase
MPAGRRNPAAGAASLGAGALVALSLPPWGWWPLAFVGIALLDLLLADRPWRSRLARGWLFGVGWLAPGMGWMWFLTAPGYVAATAIYALYLGGACAIAPGGRWRWLGLPAAITLAEALRFHFPFEGVPLASLAIGQADGPLAPLARIGGVLLLTLVTMAIGVALAALVRRRPAPAAVLAGGVAVLVVVAALAPQGHQVGTARVAFVQGGGPQGTRAIDTDPREVFERHLAATRSLQPQVDLVVWPENVVDVDDFETSRERGEIAAEAARLQAPIAVGITEDAGNRFVNAEVVVLPDGSIQSRYEKVRRVPFGEYMPMRGLLEAVGAPTNLVPRDAIAGTGPAVLDSPIGRLGVVISWEVFFGDRGQDAAEHGGRVLLNPTNGSSYTGTILQSQQVASSRLRALESGRWVVQVSPTGFSTFVTPDGDALDRTGVSEQAVRVREVGIREGTTAYVRWGDWPVLGLAFAMLAAALALQWRDDRHRPRPPAPAPSSDVQQDGDRTVVDQLDRHLGPEAPTGHGGAEAT